MTTEHRLPEPRLMKCFASKSYLLIEWHIGRIPASPFTLDIRYIDGNHTSGILLAKEDVDNLIEMITKAGYGACTMASA